MQIQATATVLLSLAFGCTPAEETPAPLERVGATSLRTTADGWASVQAHASVLLRQYKLPELSVDIQQITLETIGWSGPPKTAVWQIRFAAETSSRPIASYVVCPWQRMGQSSSPGTADPKPWGVFSINKYSVVLCPQPDLEQNSREKGLARKVAKVMDTLFSITASKQVKQRAAQSSETTAKSEGTPIVDLEFMPFHLRCTLESRSTGSSLADTSGGQWSSLVSRRVLELVRTKRNPDGTNTTTGIELYPPAEINRTRPQAKKADPQDSYPSARVRRDRALLDRKIAKIYAESIRTLLSHEDRASQSESINQHDQTLPRLESTIKKHPEHAGAGAAKGNEVFQAHKTQLHKLFAEGLFDCLPTEPSPITALEYRPSLLPTLVALPTPTRVDLAKLSRAFKKYRDISLLSWDNEEPSNAAIILAEIGDRMRTVVGLSPRPVIRSLFSIVMPGIETLTYPGFEFPTPDLQTDPKHSTSLPVPTRFEVEIDIR